MFVNGQVSHRVAICFKKYAFNIIKEIETQFCYKIKNQIKNIKIKDK